MLRSYVLHLMVLVTSPLFCYAQHNQIPPLMYITTGITAGNHFGFNASVNLILNQKHSLEIGFYTSARPSPKAPDDYKKYNDGFISNDPRPFDALKGIAFMYGRVLSVSPTGKGRINLKGGLIVGTSRINDNYGFVSNYQTSFSAKRGQYIYTVEKRSWLGVILHPVLETGSSRIIAFSGGPLLVLSNQGFLAGAGVGFSLGKVRNKAISQ